jgi:hypothetical protein
MKKWVYLISTLNFKTAAATAIERSQKGVVRHYFAGCGASGAYTLTKPVPDPDGAWDK